MIISGPSIGSRYVVPPTEGEVYDYLPEAMTRRVRNLSDFAGILVFDKWTCNADGRQAAFGSAAASESLPPASLTRDIAQCRRVELPGCAAARRLWT